jgi:carbamoyl-phosphate synthase large subunit
MRILVTAIGGDIGYGVGKILRSSRIAEFLMGCDVHGEHAGQFYFDRCEIVARADSGHYLDSLRQVARSNRIDLIIPTSEPELRYLLKAEALDGIDGIQLLTANREALRIGFDKLETSLLLQHAGLPFPWTIPVGDGDPPALPCIIKNRFGAGSKGFAKVDADNASVHARTRGTAIWQELLQPAEQEYTCGLYRSASGDIRSIVFHRRLVAGATRFGRVVGNNREISSLLAKLASAVDLQGSINVQLILTARGPVVFEINPRFSSTVVFRHLLGFQDVLWSILERCGRPIPDYVPPPSGTSFYRGVDELLIPAASQP